MNKWCHLDQPPKLIMLNNALAAAIGQGDSVTWLQLLTVPQHLQPWVEPRGGYCDSLQRRSDLIFVDKETTLKTRVSID